MNNKMYNDYWGQKNERAEIAKKHTESMAQTCKSDIEQAVRSSIIYDENHFGAYDPFTGFRHANALERFSNVHVLPMTTVEAIFSVGNLFGCGKIAVLNFASFKNPGGKFLEGSMAQEESLCHASFLYNVLSRFDTKFYSNNRKYTNRSMYVNRAIYSPKITFFYTDNDFQTHLADADVITCAAPNYTAGSKYCGVTDTENTVALYNRCRFVLDIAIENDVDTLILGAYGCGVFGQNPYMVANVFRVLFREYEYENKFSRIIFAIPNTGHGKSNFIAFNNVF